MENQRKSFLNYLLLTALLGILFLTSCKQLGLIDNPPAGDEILAPDSFDPGLELSSQYLICPTIPNTVPVIPPGPYDEDIGDCALRGKSAEIEAWLIELELIAASCQANLEPDWADALVARGYLDTKIDEFGAHEFAPITIEEDNGDGSNAGENLGQPPGYTESFGMRTCGLYNPDGSSANIPGHSNSPLESHYYTYLLIRIGENVEEYCTMIDELIKPLWQACDEINFYQDCQPPNLMQYHSIIEEGMNAAQDNYDNTGLFYLNTLQTKGWDYFRTNYSEVSLDCPLPLAPQPKFTFDVNSFCRTGPSSEYQAVATFLEGEEVLIEGRNLHEPRWWMVPNPGESGYCWVSDSTGSAEGPLENLEIVAPLPLITAQDDDKSKCIKDLGPAACVAAGGTWVDGGAVGASYCDCK